MRELVRVRASVRILSAQPRILSGGEPGWYPEEAWSPRWPRASARLGPGGDTGGPADPTCRLRPRASGGTWALLRVPRRTGALAGRGSSQAVAPRARLPAGCRPGAALRALPWGHRWFGISRRGSWLPESPRGGQRAGRVEVTGSCSLRPSAPPCWSEARLRLRPRGSVGGRERQEADDAAPPRVPAAMRTGRAPASPHSRPPRVPSSTGYAVGRACVLCGLSFPGWDL